MTSVQNPNDPFNDDEKDRLQVEALAKKFENQYVSFYFIAIVKHLIMLKLYTD